MTHTGHFYLFFLYFCTKIGALEFISDQLRRELPGLRGFSETQMKEIRLFYEGWQMLDIKPTIAIVENVDRNAIANSAVATAELQSLDNESRTNPSVTTDELIDIHHAPPSALYFAMRQIMPTLNML